MSALDSTDSAESSPAQDVAPATESPTTETPTETAVSPSEAPPPSDTGASGDTGPLPFERHKAILENARRKAAEEAVSQYAWLQEHGEPQTVQQKLAILRRAEQDPAGFARDFMAAARLSPQDIGAVAPTPKPPDNPPEPDVLFENGQMTYSRERLQEVLAWRERQLRQQLGQEIEPLRRHVAVQAVREQSEQRAQAELAQAASWPGFEESKGQLRDYLAANRTATLRDAYIAVVPALLAEKAAKASEAAYQKALTDLQAKAGAASGPAPRTGGAAPARDYSGMSMHDALVAAMSGE